MTAIGGLFFAAFLAATLFPAQSEGLLAYLIIQNEHSAVLLIAAATCGNVLGSLLNYWLGFGLIKTRLRKWLFPSEESLKRADRFYQRYGRWSLLFSWLPIIGDPLTLVAGIAKERLCVFMLLVTIAKLGRYIVVAYFAAKYI